MTPRSDPDERQLPPRIREGLQRLRRYAARQGHTAVPQDFRDEDGFRLGLWVKERRREKRKGTIRAELVPLLEGLPGWLWEVIRRRTFEDWVSLLTEYAKEKEHATPRSRERYKEAPLGLWTVAQRSAYRRGELSAGQIRAIEQIPGWTWLPGRGPAPDPGRLEALRAYAASGGSFDKIPPGAVVNGISIPETVHRLRSEHAQGVVSARRVAALEAIPGWRWSRPSRRTPLQQKAVQDFAAADGRIPTPVALRLLRQFVQEHGHTRVPKTHVVDEKRLGQWVHVRRLFYRRGKLKPGLIQALEAIPHWIWNPAEEPVPAASDIGDADAVAILRAYAKDHGSLAGMESGTRWRGVSIHALQEQLRIRNRRGDLPLGIAAEIAQIPGWAWNAYDTDLEEGIAHLERYIQMFGDSRVPEEYTVQGFQLGLWTARWRRRFRERQQLGYESARLRPLLYAGGIRRRSYRMRQELLRGLDAYVARTGHARVPTTHEEDGDALGRRVARVRAAYHLRRLTPDQIETLEGYPGWTWAAHE